MTLAHVAGFPLEESLATAGPALLAALGGFTAWLRALRVRRRPPTRPAAPAQPPSPAGEHPMPCAGRLKRHWLRPRSD